MPETLIDQIRIHHAELTGIRRDIHAHPEMGLAEVRTAVLVAAKLREWGVDVTEGVGGTFTIEWGTTPLINHPEQTVVAAAAAKTLAGEQAVEIPPVSGMLYGA